MAAEEALARALAGLGGQFGRRTSKDSNREFYKRLLAQGGDTSPSYHWAQGLGRIATGLAGGWLAGDDRRKEEEYGTAFAEAAKSGNFKSMAEAAAKAGDTGMAAQIALAEAMYGRQAEREQRTREIVTGGSPGAGAGAAVGGSLAMPGVAPGGQAMIDLVAAEAQKQGVPVEIAKRLAQAESGGSPAAVSQKGARGVMQLMPGTAAEMRVDPADPQANIAGGVAYLKQQIAKYRDTSLALMAYNWGPGAVDAWLKSGADPSKVPAETRAYVAKILGETDPATMAQAPYPRQPGVAAGPDAPVQSAALPPPAAGQPVQPAMPLQATGPAAAPVAAPPGVSAPVPPPPGPAPVAAPQTMPPGMLSASAAEGAPPPPLSTQPAGMIEPPVPPQFQTTPPAMPGGMIAGGPMDGGSAGAGAAQAIAAALAGRPSEMAATPPRSATAAEGPEAALAQATAPPPQPGMDVPPPSPIVRTQANMPAPAPVQPAPPVAPPQAQPAQAAPRPEYPPYVPQQSQAAAEAQRYAAQAAEAKGKANQLYAIKNDALGAQYMAQARALEERAALAARDAQAHASAEAARRNAYEVAKVEFDAKRAAEARAEATAARAEGAPMRASAAEMAKLRDARAEAETINKALDDYGALMSKATTSERFSAATIPGSKASQLNTAYYSAMLLAKGEALFNLGVLNGPDLEIIRKTLTDPSQLTRVGVGPEAIKGQIDQIKALITNRIAAKERQLGVSGLPTVPTEAAPAGQPAEAAPQRPPPPPGFRVQ